MTPEFFELKIYILKIVFFYSVFEIEMTFLCTFVVLISLLLSMEVYAYPFGPSKSENILICTFNCETNLYMCVSRKDENLEACIRDKSTCSKKCRDKTKENLLQRMKAIAKTFKKLK